MRATCWIVVVGCGICFFPGNVSHAQRPNVAHRTAAFSIASILRHDDALNEAHDVELQGDLAYVPGKGGSIAIIDVADPRRPTLFWFRRDQELFPDSETVLLGAGCLFLGTRDFHSVDVSNPRAPVFDATLIDRTKIDKINGMVLRGDYVFAASKEGTIDAFDVSEPPSPKLAGVIRAREQHHIISPHDIDLVGPFVVVVDPNGFGERPGSVALFRVFDHRGKLLPEAKRDLAGRVTAVALSGSNRVQVRGHYAYVGASYSPRFSSGKVMAKGIVVDLSEPAAPQVVATVEFPDVRGPNGLTISGNVWFLAGGQTVAAYDIRDPVHPRRLTSFTSFDAFPTADDNAHDLVYRDGYLYVTSQGDNGFVILHVEDDEMRRLAAAKWAS